MYGRRNKNAKVLHVTGITPILSEDCKAAVYKALEFAERYGLKVSFDLNIRRKLCKNQDYIPLIQDICKKSNIIFCGLDEAKMIYGVSEIDAIFVNNEKTEIIALKNGAKGA